MTMEGKPSPSPASGGAEDRRLENLSFSRFTAYFEVTGPVSLPPFTGSTFHGVLGHAVQAVRPDSSRLLCRQCHCRAECQGQILADFFFKAPAAHPLLHESQAVIPPRYRRETYPPALILEPPPGGEYSSGEFIPLAFLLVGRAIRYFPFLTCALQNVATRPVGRGPGRLRLHAVSDGFPAASGEETLIYDGHADDLQGPGQVLDLPLLSAWAREQSSLAAVASHWVLRFLTPFSYRFEDRFGEKLTFTIFLRNLLRRFTLLSVYSPLTQPIDYRGLLEQAAAISVRDDSRLRWQNLKRYSARTDRRMKYHGWTGDLALQGPLSPFLPYLKLGEFLHVGKMTSFGLGQYQILYS